MYLPLTTKRSLLRPATIGYAENNGWVVRLVFPFPGSIVTEATTAPLPLRQPEAYSFGQPAAARSFHWPAVYKPRLLTVPSTGPLLQANSYCPGTSGTAWQITGSCPKCNFNKDAWPGKSIG